MAKRLTRDAPQLRAEKPSVLPAILRYFVSDTFNTTRLASVCARVIPSDLFGLISR